MNLQRNMRAVSAALAGVICAAFASTATAQGTPSSKATADISTVVKCNMSTATTNDGAAVLPTQCFDLYTGAQVQVANQWVTIMRKPMKVSNSQSIIVSPSLVTGLYTRTRTKTSTGETSTAEAMGGVYLRAVLEDAAGNELVTAAPLSSCASGLLGCQSVDNKWGVELDTRVQTLTQSLSECTVFDLTGAQSGTCSFTSTIDLILKTTSAHTFNFVFPNVGQGTYYVAIKAAVASGASVIGSGAAVGAAAFGLGSMVAESVRFVHGFEF
jgi:hypothetical protein